MIRIIVTFCFACCFLTFFSFGQGQQPPSDRLTPSIIDVELLSDAQINAFWFEAKRAGLTLKDLPQYLTSKGISYIDSQTIVERINEMENESSVSAGQADLRDQQPSAGEDIFKTLAKDPLEFLTSYERRIYGYQFFYNRRLDFSPNLNLATPMGYIVGPGDRLKVIIYGATQAEYDLQVNPEGNITLPFIGPIQVSGLTLTATKSTIESNLKRIYSGLKGPNPSVFIDITISNVRTIKINVMGEVNKPGTYAVPSFSSLFNVMYAAGGPTINGTFRHLKVYRGNILIQTVDLYPFISNGQQGLNTPLSDDDVIIVSPYDRRVEIAGEVKSPGFFEPGGSETIEDMIMYAGGFTAAANKNLFTLERLKGEKKSISELLPTTSVAELKDGDRILISEAIDPYVEKIQITGAVQQPGSYTFKEGMNLQDLVDEAKGMLPEAHDKRFTIFKMDEDLIPKAISIDIDNGTSLSSVKLNMGDVVYIPSRVETTETLKVEVSGAVNDEGVYPYYEGMTLYDAIVLSKGLRNSAYGGRIELARRLDTLGNEFQISQFNITDNILDLANVELQPLDHLFVRNIAGYRYERIVRVEGEVNFPGEYSITDGNMRISDLLGRVGGFTPNAYLEGATIFRRVTNNQDELKDLDDKTQRELASILEFLNNKEFSQTISPKQYEIIRDRYYSLRSQEVLKSLQSGLQSVSDSSDTNLNRENGTTSEYVQIGVAVSDVLKNQNSPSNLVLLDGDRLVIPKNANTVSVEGEVFEPATVKYVKGDRLKEYVNQSGGFTLQAKVGRSYIIYPNGEAARVKNFLFFRTWPEVKSGSRIVIPDGRIRGQFNPERVLSLTTSLLTTYLFVQTLIDQQSSNP
jgi:protein involved in polysaccharide export with SLBB domain